MHRVLRDRTETADLIGLVSRQLRGPPGRREDSSIINLFPRLRHEDVLLRRKRNRNYLLSRTLLWTN